MKKTGILIILILSILSSFCFVAHAEGEAFTVEIKADKTIAYQGETFNVDVFVTQITVPTGIIGAEIPLVYDANDVTLEHVTATFPSSWGGGHQDTPNIGNHILRVMVDSSDVAVFDEGVCDDNIIGFKVRFRVKTDAKKETTLAVSSDNLICCTTASDGWNVLPGIPDSMSIKLNSAEVSSAEVSEEPPHSVADDESYEEDVTTDVTISEDGNSSAETFSSEDVTASGNPTEDVTASENPTEETSENVSSSGNISQGSTADSDPSNDSAADTTVSEGNESQLSSQGNDDGEGGLGIILYIIIGAVAIAACAFTFYFVKNKKEADDMNPVNPS